MPLLAQSSSFPNGALIPGDYAFAVRRGDDVVPAGGNRSPHLRWSGAPPDTRSLAVLVVDPDVPVDLTNAGVLGTVIERDVPRRDFAHLVLVDLPPTVTELAEGALGSGVHPGGKPPGPTATGGVTGLNDYTSFFAGDEQMSGRYGGYDGPFPPPNDERAHTYHLGVYALDVDTLGLTGDFGLADARRAMAGRVLASGEWTGVYSLHPGVLDELERSG